jgi:phytoene desaturase
MRIVVVGSGFGGLSAAIRLQAQGHEVTVVEKRDKPGGRAYVYEQDGFTFDGGPTIITAPWLIDDLFSLAGRRRADYVRLVPVDPFYNVRFDDGSVFRYDGDRAHVLDEIRKFNPDDVEGYLRFVAGGDAIFETGFGLIDKPFHRLADMLRVLPDLVRLRSDRSVAAYVNRFIKDERLRQVFSFHPLLVGGNPFQTTSIYTLIHTLEQRWGVWFAMGGTGALVRAFARLFEELGGELRLSTEVDEIEVDDRRGVATGVRLRGGERLPADAVVSNADVAYTYLHMLPARVRRRNTDARIRRLRYSMSLFVIYFGTDRRYEDVAHHEILMGRATAGCSTTSSRGSGWRRTSRSTSTAPRPPTRASRRRGATRGTCSRPCRTWAGAPTGARRLGRTGTRSCAGSRSGTYPTCPGTSSPSTTSTRSTSRGR